MATYLQAASISTDLFPAVPVQTQNKEPPSRLQAVKLAEGAAEEALRLASYQAATDADEVDLDLLMALLEYICGADARSAVGGAILVFLPGMWQFAKFGQHLCLENE